MKVQNERTVDGRNEEQMVCFAKLLHGLTGAKKQRLETSSLGCVSLYILA
jgi:hypothetical protein